MAQSGPPTSIIKIAGVGFRLSLLLNAGACQIAQSGIEIHSIAKGVSLFSLMLKQAGQTLQAAHVECSRDATDKAWEIAGQGRAIFDGIEQMLDKLKGTDAHEHLRTLPLQQRVKWCFKKQHVTYLLAQLESLKLGLAVMLQILRLGQLMNVKNATEPAAEDDVIAQEKVEAQNMIIVRYWSVKRLERLWELVEQEALEADNDPTSRMISSHYLYSVNSMSLTPSSARPHGTETIKLPAISFGESDGELSLMERSPKEMVHLSQSVMARLLSQWTCLSNRSGSWNAGRSLAQRGREGLDPPSPYLSSDRSDEEEEDGVNFEGHEIQGYYLEGTTVDWRRPQSHEARHHAARLRKQYSKYQAHVDSDSDSSQGSSDDENQSVDEQPPFHVPQQNGGTAAKNIPRIKIANSRPERDRKPDVRVDDNNLSRSPDVANPRPPLYAHPAPAYYSATPRQQYRHPSQPHSQTPRSIPIIRRPSSKSGAPPQGTTPSVHFETHAATSPAYGSYSPRLQPRYHPRRASSTSPLGMRETSSSRSKASRDAKERHGTFTRNATKGLVGISAIAGFMDALEAFSVI